MNVPANDANGGKRGLPFHRIQSPRLHERVGCRIDFGLGMNRFQPWFPQLMNQSAGCGPCGSNNFLMDSPVWLIL
jgi:hypothetical protein